MVMSASAYVRMLKGLLPKGALWSAPAGSVLYKLLQAMADELVRVDAIIAGCIDEADPFTTNQLLTDWERVVGIPDTCGGLKTTIPERRQQLIARLSARGGQSRKFFIDLAASIGFTITISEFRPFLAGRSYSGDSLTNDGWIFTWRINAQSTQSALFLAGTSHAGDRLGFSNDQNLECLMNRHKPAHTVLLFKYTF